MQVCSVVVRVSALRFALMPEDARKSVATSASSRRAVRGRGVSGRTPFVGEAGTYNHDAPPSLRAPVHRDLPRREPAAELCRGPQKTRSAPPYATSDGITSSRSGSSAAEGITSS